MKKDIETGYALIEHIHGVVLPAELAVQVFTLLCKGEKVSYDWQSKTYRRENEHLPALRVFSATDHAGLALNQD